MNITQKLAEIDAEVAQAIGNLETVSRVANMTTGEAITLIDAENTRLGSPGFLETLEELQRQLAEDLPVDLELRRAYRIVMQAGRAMFAPA